MVRHWQSARRLWLDTSMLINIIYIQMLSKFRDWSEDSTPLLFNDSESIFANFNPLSTHDALKHHFTSLKTH